MWNQIELHRRENLPDSGNCTDVKYPQTQKQHVHKKRMFTKQQHVDTTKQRNNEKDDNHGYIHGSTGSLPCKYILLVTDSCRGLYIGFVVANH